MRSDTGTYALHIVVGFALLVMVFLVFMEPETYEFLFPFIFFTSAAFALFGSWLSMRRSPKKERRRTMLGGGDPVRNFHLPGDSCRGGGLAETLVTKKRLGEMH